MKPGTVVGLACGFIALTLITVGAALAWGPWGLLGSAAPWLAAMLLLADFGDLYARNS